MSLKEHLVTAHEVQMAKIIKTQEHQKALLERITAAEAFMQQPSGLAQQSSGINSLVLHLQEVGNLHQ